MFEDKVLERDDFSIDQAKASNPPPPRSARQPRTKARPPGSLRHRPNRTRSRCGRPASSAGTACCIGRLS